MSDKNFLTLRQSELLRLFKWEQKISSAQLLSGINHDISIATLKRDLSALNESSYITKLGANRDAEYELTGYALVHRPFKLGSYYLEQDDKRGVMEKYNLDIFDVLLREPLYTDDEVKQLENATEVFKQNAIEASEVIYKKELERFIIEFSWKSSQIEGNTYTLLETERLIREGLKKDNRSEFETSMILNHKKAYEFLLDQANEGELKLSRRSIEEIHSLVVRDLGIGVGLRRAAVGISGSLYKPLSLIYQIEEQLEKLIDCINNKQSPYEKALIAVLGESYLQPFEDGNKRTARILANGILLRAKHAPLSYRSVNVQDYNEACFIFYEQNSIEPFKKLFIDQYVFAAQNYNLAKNS